jgi:MFS family permease
MWMNDVAAAWVMTSLTTSPVMVALVQSASTLPMFLLGIPSGTFADILDRRKYFIAAQCCAATVALLSFVALLLGQMTVPLLLALTFFNGVSLAMRWPVASATVPETVPAHLLPSALALNAVAFNAARIVGPLFAGIVISTAGSTYVFALNLVLSMVSGLLIVSWKRTPQPPRSAPPEQLLGAIRVGVQYAWRTARMRSILMRVWLFFLHSSAVLALLPLVARGLPGGSAATYTTLMAAMGAGAVIALMTVLPRARKAMSSESLLRNGTLLMSGALIALALAPNVQVAFVAMLAAGVAWISVANSLTVLSQTALPDWVRARGMSIHLMSLMGGSALGAALWGRVAAFTDVETALTLAAASAALFQWVLRKSKIAA